MQLTRQLRLIGLSAASVLLAIIPLAVWSILLDHEIAGIEWFYRVAIGLFFLLIVTLSLSTIIVSNRLRRLITTRLQALYLGSQKISEGDFAHSIEEGTDEFSDLSRSINSAAVNFQKLNSAAETKIAELTTALLKLEGDKAATLVNDTTKSALLVSLSLGIKAPLIRILENLELLQETELSTEQIPVAGGISESGTMVLHIVNNVLIFSDLEAGKVQVEPGEFDIFEYLSDVMEPFRTAAQNKNIAFAFHCDKPSHFVDGDKIKIGQIVSELVSNAIKFTEKGRVSIRTTLRNDGDSTAIIVTITDTGIGIPETAFSKIFQVSPQNSTSSVYGGIGLGLRVAKYLVDLIGGSITFKSRLGEGSSFDLNLQLRTGAELKTQIELVRETPVEVTARVLVAEDNPTSQFVITRFLVKLGIIYDIAENGVDVLSKLHQSHFDLLLMDCQMPVMDGYATAKLIRVNKEFSNIPIVALSANASHSEELTCLEAGMNGYLAKPVNRTTLEAEIRKHLKQESKSDVIDWTVLSQFDELQMPGQPDALLEFLYIYLRTSQLKVTAMKRHMMREDLVALSWEAHAMKTGSRTVGANALADLCSQIEALGATKNVPQASTLFKSLLNIYALTCNELKKIKAEREKMPRISAA